MLKDMWPLYDLALLSPVRMNDEGALRFASAVPVSCLWQRSRDQGVFCGSWAFAKLNRNDTCRITMIYMTITMTIVL